MATSDRWSNSIQRKGVRVAVVSTISTQPPMVADELRRQADEFIDLAHLIQRIGRDPGDRPQRPADHRRGQYGPVQQPAEELRE